MILSWPGNVPPEGWRVIERNPAPTYAGILIEKVANGEGHKAEAR